MNGKHIGYLGEEQGEKGQDGHDMKKAVVVVMKERHRVFPGTLFLGINDELTPGQQTAVVWRWSQRGGHLSFVHSCCTGSE